MKRRGFLQTLSGAVAALFVPKVATASKDEICGFRPWNGKGGVIRPHTLPDLMSVTIKDRPISTGDLVVWDGDKCRLARNSDNLNLPNNKTAIAIPDGNGGFHYMREGMHLLQASA